MRTYRVIVHEAEPDEGGYWAEVENLPGCFASGETLDELDRDVRDAIETYLASLRAHGDPIPEGTGSTSERLWEIAVA